jgi:hypothetical protein
MAHGALRYVIPSTRVKASERNLFGAPSYIRLMRRILA